MPEKESLTPPPAHAHEPWLSDLRRRIHTGAAAQFVLTGNTRDTFVSESPVSLQELLVNKALDKAHVILAISAWGKIEVLREEKLAKPPPQINHDSFALAIKGFDQYWRTLGATDQASVAVLIELPRALAGVSDAVPADPEMERTAEILASWAAPFPFLERKLFSILLAESAMSLHPVLAQNRTASHLHVPYPGAAELQALAKITGQPLPETARFPLGLTLTNSASAPTSEDSTVPRPVPQLDAIIGQEEVRAHLKQDFQLWRQGDLKAISAYYLLCGPMGVGKQTLARAVAADAGVPVFVPEAAYQFQPPDRSFDISDWLARVDAQPGGILLFPDAEKLPGLGLAPSDAEPLAAARFQYYLRNFVQRDRTRRFLIFVTSSRPDFLVPYSLLTGGEDLRLPLFPTSHTHEGFRLIQSILKHTFELDLPETDYYAVEENIPWLLTAAEAYLLAAKTYRLVRLKDAPIAKAFNRAAKQHHSPLENKVLEHQIRVAIEESAEPGFVPELIRNHFVAP